MAAQTKAGYESLVGNYLQFALDEGKYEERNDPTRVEFLRVSSFPFCARQNYLKLPEASNKSKEVSVSETFYFSVGHMFHDLKQKAMTHADFRVLNKVPDANDRPLRSPGGMVLVANWLCPVCGLVHVFRPHPKACDHCGYRGVLTHREHRVSYGGVVRGHMDGSLAYSHDGSKEYSKRWVHIPIDFKTAGAAKVKGGSGLPYPDNVEQLSSYAAIKRNAGYNVPGSALVYISRDNPHNRLTKYTPLDYEGQITKIDGWVEQWKKSRKATTIEAAMKLPPVVTTDFHINCTYCEFKTVCQAEEQGNMKPLRTALESTVRFMNSPRRSGHGFPE